MKVSSWLAVGLVLYYVSKCEIRMRTLTDWHSWMKMDRLWMLLNQVQQLFPKEYPILVGELYFFVIRRKMIKAFKVPVRYRKVCSGCASCRSGEGPCGRSEGLDLTWFLVSSSRALIIAAEQATLKGRRSLSGMPCLRRVALKRRVTKV